MKIAAAASTVTITITITVTDAVPTSNNGKIIALTFTGVPIAVIC